MMLGRPPYDNYVNAPDTRAEINALATDFDVPVSPIADTLTHTNRISFLTFPIVSDRDAPLLEYGMRYMSNRALAANRTGWLSEGEPVVFVGYYSFPYDNGLRLFFEDDARQKFVLEFEGNMPDLDGITMWTPQMTKDYLVRKPDTARGLELQALARVVNTLKGTVDRKDPRAEPQ